MNDLHHLKTPSAPSAIASRFSSVKDLLGTALVSLANMEYYRGNLHGSGVMMRLNRAVCEETHEGEPTVADLVTSHSAMLWNRSSLMLGDLAYFNYWYDLELRRLGERD